MKIIKNEVFEGERPLYGSHNLRLENVTILPGESAIKECSNIEVIECEFNGKYPFWHNDHTLIEKCYFKEGGRAAIWYSKNIRMLNTLVEAPKMFREIDGLYVENTRLTHAAECCWNCRNIEFHNVDVKEGDYIFMNGQNIRMDGFWLNGNYSFQDAKNVEIRNAHLNSKDAFWNSENVTVYDSVLKGEYLGWHSKNLRLVNCTIYGTQPLCYATGLVLENCIMGEDADLCFENSTLHACIKSPVVSIKNPAGGMIIAQSIGETILDEYCKNPGACTIKLCNELTCTEKDEIRL